MRLASIAALPGRAWRKLRRYATLRDIGIVVETSNSCNARCVWCWMYNSGRKATGLMRFEDFSRFVDMNLPLLRRNWFVPYHRGEPLIHPRFLDMMEYAGDKGCLLSDLSTNLSVKIDIERLLATRISSYMVNVGGTTGEVHRQVMRHSDWDTVTGNLRLMFELGPRYGRQIKVKMNPTRQNVKQIPDLPGFVVSVGGKPEDAIVSTTGFNIPAMATLEEKKAFLRDVVSDEVRQHLRFTYDLSAADLAIRAKSRSPVCRFLMPTVKYDGRVTVCCHDQVDRLNLGDAFSRPLREILTSARYRWFALRGFLRTMDFCRECN